MGPTILLTGLPYRLPIVPNSALAKGVPVLIIAHGFPTRWAAYVLTCQLYFFAIHAPFTYPARAGSVLFPRLTNFVQMARMCDPPARLIAAFHI